MLQTTPKKIPKKRWLYLLPVFFLIQFFAYMDRGTISIALPGGMLKDLAMNASIAGLATGIFALGTLFLSVPAGHLAEKGKSKLLVSVCIIVWSVCTLLTGLVQSGIQLVILRFILGLAEGSLVATLMTLLTFWFPNKGGERNKAFSVLATGSNVPGIIGPPIMGAIIAYYNWRYLYLILGIISLASAFVWMAVAKERPKDAKWLSKEERDFIETTIKEEKEKVIQANKDIKVKGNKLPIGLLLRNKNIWILCIIGFCVSLGQLGYSMWIPVMIQNATSSGIMGVGLLTPLPYIIAVIGLWVWTFIASKIKDHRRTTGLAVLGFAITLILANIIGGSAAIAITMMCVVSLFALGYTASYNAIPSLILIPELDGPARGMMVVAQGLGSFLGPFLVGIFMTHTGSQTTGIYFLAFVLLFGYLTSLLLPKKIGGQNIPNEGVNTQSAKVAQ
ncbi:MFS transporter [Bacillus sp. 1P06AnD]|uniref:MFS transporter n=1 Tax=Bacillus sp. 1P06AnD TaxID=3132208 RepID=UPI0039A21B4F